MSVKLASPSKNILRERTSFAREPADKEILKKRHSQNA
jgi:hypothetical protein